MVAIWEEIELSESYLVCCMFEEAATIASSVLKHVCDNKSTDVGEDDQLYDIMESAGMVLVQSLKELGRTLEILNELRQLFGSVTAIPIQVLLAGACFEISEGSTFGVKQFLEEFLGKWRYVDEQYYVPAGREPNVVCVGGCDRSFTLGIGEYLEVVDVYVVTLLGSVLNDMEHAFSWVEKAELPEEKRKELLMTLHSLYPPKAKLSQGSLSNSLVDDHEAHCSSSKEVILPEGHLKGLKPQYPPINGEKDRRKTVLNLSKRMDSCFWWYRSITLKLGNTRVVISNGKITLGCLIFLAYYIFRRKRATLKRIASRQVSSMKEALTSLWQLAFSYQVNPLAALQPLPAAAPGNRS
ncbi:hypothetical protein PVL29_027263 [Vitis rotundifolia]|uniref:3-phosphoinositide-dependent protein kinase-1 n=1 Tax=Vitis rotundifolia TaxID=103349 RepID=A0AA38YIP5_VITRO|nr:hypothetical protein PVL29_027263 [Vitis rotundifolia]